VEVLLGAWLVRLVKQSRSGGAAWCLVVEARQAEQGVEVLLGAWLLRLVKQAGSGGAAWCLVGAARQAEQEWRCCLVLGC